MTHPGLHNYLDYPDVASVGCPTPRLFLNGLQDKLFPFASVHDACRKLHQSGQTKLWDEKHMFNRDMQLEVFAWLDKTLK